VNTACPTGCGRTRKGGHLMCGACWRMVPKHLQSDVNRTWWAILRGRKGASLETYQAAADAAIGSVP